LNSKYKVIIVITSLLIVLSISISFVNYVVSLNSAQKQLKNQSLPLSLDNIYSDIQKNIIQPYLVSSMMANDTFVHDWLLNEESNEKKIIKYLEAIKNKYNMFNTFLVSNETKNYYTPHGVVEKIKKDNPANKWYFDFYSSQGKHEINLDFNEHLSNNMIMFINYKIFDSNFHFIGATGVAIKISYIDELLETFRSKYNFHVTFFDKNGRVVLSERKFYKYKTIKEDKTLKKFENVIISKKSNIIEYEHNDSKYIINTKYIPELDLYLTVKVNLDDFTEDVKNIFYFNLITSIFITFIIAFIVFYIIRNYSKKLEYLSQYDSLTDLSNRRDFEEKLNRQIDLHKRKPQHISFVFLDIDNFKSINDNYGHAKGDLVLKEIANILKRNTRKTDILGRWGGEEFVISFIGSSLENAISVCENIRKEIESNIKIKKLVSLKVTASLGITMLKQTDTVDTITSRADEAMYKSKKNGKNQINSL